MGSRYELGVAKAGVNAANTVMWCFRAPTRRAWLMELGIFVDVAPSTAPQFVLARNTAGTVTPSTTSTGLGSVPEVGASTCSLDSAWTTPPTFTTTGPFIRRMTLPITAGSGIIWSWPGDMVVSTTITTSLVVANAAATGATLGQFSMYASWAEG